MLVRMTGFCLRTHVLLCSLEKKNRFSRHCYKTCQETSVNQRKHKLWWDNKASKIFHVCPFTGGRNYPTLNFAPSFTGQKTRNIYRKQNWVLKPMSIENYQQSWVDEQPGTSIQMTCLVLSNNHGAVTPASPEVELDVLWKQGVKGNLLLDGNPILITKID